MAEVVQCDSCKEEVPEDKFINRITLGRRMAVVGKAIELSDEQEVCTSCFEKVRLGIAPTGWPEVMDK